MRKINENIRRAYRIKQANRLDTIRQVQQALRETTPKHVIRLDIKSFYESVPRRVLLNRLRADRLVSTRTLDLLTRLLKLVSHLGTSGLPRGLQVSATLVINAILGLVLGCLIQTFVDRVDVCRTAGVTVLPCVLKL